MQFALSIAYFAIFVGALLGAVWWAYRAGKIDGRLKAETDYRPDTPATAIITQDADGMYRAEVGYDYADMAFEPVLAATGDLRQAGADRLAARLRGFMPTADIRFHGGTKVESRPSPPPEIPGATTIPEEIREIKSTLRHHASTLEAHAGHLARLERRTRPLIEDSETGESDGNDTETTG